VTQFCGPDRAVVYRKTRPETLGVRRLKRVLGASAAVLCFLSGIVLAADLPTQKGSPPAAAPVPAGYNWTGFYVGFNAGYGWSNSNKESNNVFPFAGAAPINGFIPVSGNNNGGFIGGFQGGYNYQFGIDRGFVLGVEADIDHANLGRATNNVLLGSFALPQFPATVFTPLAPLRGNSNQYFGTVRLRAGYALDRVFLYGTGGLAFGGLRNNGNGFGGGFSETTLAGNFDPVAGAVVANDTTNFVGAAARKSSSRTGWTLGLGGEYAFWNNWSVKVEYLYVNLGNSNTAPAFLLPGVVAVANNDRGRNANIVRMGVNYKFW
jgi:outer membrane immunogenic protein